MIDTKHMESGKKGHEKAGWILLLESAISLAASLLAVLLVRWLYEPIPGYTRLVLLWLCISLAASLAGMIITGSHKIVRSWLTLRSASRIAGAVVIKEALLAIALVTGLVSMPDVTHGVMAILADMVLSLALLLYSRFTKQIFSKDDVHKVRSEAFKKNALVHGTDERAVGLAHEIQAEGRYGVVGFITTDKTMAGMVIDDIIVYYCAGPEDFDQLQWRLGGVDSVFFPKSEESGGGIRNASGSESGTDIVKDGMSLAGRVLKRSFDIILSSLLIIIFSPLALLSALAIKLDDGGPILYKQERIGRGGKPFQILKFRSMRTDAEAGGAMLYSGEKDPRLTRAGAFLRQHHLDELPQLVNVFRGDMSFIGYRPERRYYIDQIMEHNPRYRYLYQIRPGVTSYATLYNGYTDTMEKMLTRLDLDLYYLRNHSVVFDLRVLGLTFLSIVSGKKF